MSTSTLPAQSRVETILQRCRRQILIHNLLSSLALLCTVVLGGIVLAAASDFLIGLPGVIRAGLLVAGGLAALWVLFRHVLAAWQISIPAAELGAAVDLSSPELQESLTTLLSLQRPNVTSGEAGSALMREHLQQQVAGKLNGLNHDSFVETRRTIKHCLIAALVMGIALLPSMLWPTGSKLLLARLFQPFGNYETATNLYFDVQNGSRTVAKDSDVVIAAVPKWRTKTPGTRPDSVQLELTSSDERTEVVPMVYDETNERFVAELPDIQQSIQYRVTCGRSGSKSYQLNVVDAPEVIAAVMTATPPVYTGRPVEQFDGMVGEMKVFERSKLQLHLEFNKPVTSAALVWQRRDERPLTDVEAFNVEFDHVTGEIVEPDFEDLDPDAPVPVPLSDLPVRIPFELSADGTAAQLSMTADFGGEFALEVRDEFDLPNSSEPDRYLNVQYDQPPELLVSGLRDGDALRPNDILPVNCRVTDDIGIGRLELHYRINNDAMKIVPATGLERGSLRVEHPFRLALEELEVANADMVTVRVRTMDERPDPRPHEVWSQELTFRIDDNAAAAGAQALSEATQQLIDQLKKLEAELHHDANQSRELKQQADKTWDDEQREQTQGLSEKEQQQGRQLKQIAQEVDSHPLMREAAAELHQVSQRLQQQIPAQLDAAANQDRRKAAQQLDKVQQQLREAAQQIARQIGQIENQAKLEQNLAELNRLALEAEQLALQAEQLEQDQQSAEQPPAGVTEQQQQANLDRRQQHLNQQQQQLRSDIGQLLQKEQELLQSAQKSQQDQLARLAEQTRQLAAQQKKLADAVQQEAREAGQQANGPLRKIEQVRRDADQFNRKLKELDSAAEPPNLQPLQDAIKELRQGNLTKPIDDLNQLADNFEETAEQLQADNPSRQPAAAEDENENENEKETSSDANNEAATKADAEQNTADEPDPQSDADKKTDQTEPASPRSNDPQRQQAATSAAELADRLSDISRELDQLREARTRPAAKSTADQPTADKPAPQNEQTPPPNAQPVPSTDAAAADAENALRLPVTDLLERLDQLTDASSELSQDLQQQSQLDRNARRQVKTAAEQTAKANQEAHAGQFSKSADLLRRAAGAASNSATAIPQPAEADRRQQMQKLSDELGRMAGQLDNLQRDDSAQAAAQRQTQEQIATQTQQLPAQLNDLAERLGLPELQLPQPAAQAGEAQQAAAQAQQSAQQAVDQLQKSDLQQASADGKTTAEQLNQAAQLAQQAAADSQNRSNAVPTDVGERVADALQQLQQAAEAMNSPEANNETADAGQQSEQSASGQDGQPPADGEQMAQAQPGQQGQDSSEQNGQAGQAGEGSSGSQQLNDAAQSLADAAKNALPSQFNPGQMNEGSSGTQGANAMGNSSLWDGQLPGQGAGPAGSRDWGSLNQELQTETADQLGVSRDSEYEALIRMYFREVAKATGR